MEHAKQGGGSNSIHIYETTATGQSKINKMPNLYLNKIK